jgi:hypothetical protein
MKKDFKHHYPQAKEFFDTLWKDALIVPDTNVLLNLYQYTKKTLDGWIKIFDRVKGRLWIPHQIGLEFFERRPSLIFRQLGLYKEVGAIISDLRDNAKKEMGKLRFEEHSQIDPQIIEKSLAALEEKIKGLAKTHPDFAENDPILDHLTAYFEDKVGAPYSEDDLAKVYKRAEERFKLEIPPGYEDARGKNPKPGLRRYGDYVLWRQILDEAKKTKPGVIFISNDRKGDWVNRSDLVSFGCRPELRDEMEREAGCGFHLYSAQQFFQEAGKRLKIEVTNESVEEVKVIQETFTLPLSFESEARRQASKRDREELFKNLLEAFQPTEDLDEKRSILWDPFKKVVPDKVFWIHHGHKNPEAEPPKDSQE